MKSKRYETRVQISPQPHNGHMSYMWQNVQITNESVMTVSHGWSLFLNDAYQNALDDAEERGLLGYEE